MIQQIRKPCSGRSTSLHQVVLTRFALYGLLLVIVALFLACTKVEDEPSSNVSAAREATKDIQDLKVSMKKIEPFFKPMGTPAAYDWLASHNEPGQTFDEYLNSDPTKPTNERPKIYVLPLGTFTPQQKKIIEVTAGYLEAFYDLPVQQMPAQTLKSPASAKDRRYNEFLRSNQIRTGYINEKILMPILPSDAAALIGLTNVDLYPDESMSYVFGQASLNDRVGVWSLFRLEPGADQQTILRRMLKIGAHETGHMFSMKHCIKYECVMSGTNHIVETDSRPIDACPECMAKICWLSDVDPAARYDRLAAFCRKNGLNKEADEFARKSTAVNKN